MLFGIAGPTASGKTTVTRILTDEYGAGYMRYSLVLADIAYERNLDPTDKATLQNLYVTLREERGEDWLATETAVRAQELSTLHLVIEGNRRKVDLETLHAVARTRDETLLFIFIDANPNTRFIRYNKRLQQNGKQPITREAFEVLEQNPAEDEVNDLRTYAKQNGIYIDTDSYDIKQTKSLVRNTLQTEGL